MKVRFRMILVNDEIKKAPRFVLSPCIVPQGKDAWNRRNKLEALKTPRPEKRW